VEFVVLSALLGKKHMPFGIIIFVIIIISLFSVICIISCVIDLF